MIFAVGLVTIAAVGFFIYGKNITKHEENDFCLLPWAIFLFLATLDVINILLSTDFTAIEYIAGIVMFLGPVYIFTLIVGAMWKKLPQKNKNTKFIIQSLYQEATNSLPQSIILGTGILLMIGLTSIEYFTRYGELQTVEYGFAIATILLDLVAISTISEEIEESPEAFEPYSWYYWAVASGGAFLFNGLNYQEWYSVGSLLIIENVCVSLWVIRCIFRTKRWSSVSRKKLPAYKPGAFIISAWVYIS